MCISRMHGASSTQFSTNLYVVIQGSSAGALFDDLLAELPTILDNFFTNTSSDYIGVIGLEWWRATK